VLLNQRCPLALSFESMFRARMLKILLQQYLPQRKHPVELSITHIFGLLSGTSGDENLNQKNPL